MSTHNKSFNEEMAKNFFQLSSNLIKYAPISSSVQLLANNALGNKKLMN